MSLSFYARNVASGERARRRIMREGQTMKGDKLWTDAEDAILRKFAPDYAKIHEELRHRTPIAIAVRCRLFGFRKRAQHVWTGAEISKLRRMYPESPKEEICAAFPHSTWINIRQVARYNGFRRKPLSYSPTGFPILDEVRRRCREIRWSMPDLDKAAKTKNYFSQAKWFSKKRVNHRALGRAIEALDGQIKAEWND